MSNEEVKPQGQTVPVETTTPPVDLAAEVERLKAEKLKAEETAENYKKENEKYRQKKERILAGTEVKTEMPEIQRDFLSKKQDVVDEIGEEINQLDENEWETIRHLVGPATDNVLQVATREHRFVAKGEIKRAITDLVKYAKSQKGNVSEIEKARIEGAVEMGKREQAEIRGVKFTPSQDEFTAEVKALAEEKGWPIETAKSVIEKRKERDREYAVRGKY